MPYFPTTWTNDAAPAINAANLQKLEDAVRDVFVIAENAAAAIGNITTQSANTLSVANSALAAANQAQSEVNALELVVQNLQTLIDNPVTPKVSIGASVTLTIADHSGNYLEFTGNTAKVVTLGDLAGFDAYLYNNGSGAGLITFSGAVILRGPATLAPGQGARVQGSSGGAWQVSPEDVVRDRNEWSAKGENTGQTYSLDVSTGIFSSSANLHFVHRGNNRRIRLFPNGGPFTTPALATGNVLYVRYSTIIQRGMGSTYLQAGDLLTTTWTTANTLPEDAIVLLSRNANNYEGLLADLISPAATAPAFTQAGSWKLAGGITSFNCSLVENGNNVKFTASGNILVWTNIYSPDESGRIFANGGVGGIYETPEVPPLSCLYVLDSDLTALGQGGYLDHTTKMFVASYWTSASTIPDNAVILLWNGIAGGKSYWGPLADMARASKLVALELAVQGVSPVLDGPVQPDAINVMPIFSAKYMDKGHAANVSEEIGDCWIYGLGDSLLARLDSTSFHDSATQQIRPPMMHGKNFLSMLWDYIAWSSQFYRRHDYAGFFTESTPFTTVGFPEAGAWGTPGTWDDEGDRPAVTRYLSSAAIQTLSFIIPVNAWRFNWIYRTVPDGALLTVSVAEGNGVLQVWDGSAWIEANGSTVDLNEARTGAGYGNTEYQKRLMFRAKNTGGLDSRNITKTITLSKANTGTARVIAYWGVEWSLDRHMLYLVNIARGSHTLTQLRQYIKTDLYDRRPDLVLFEIPTFNNNFDDPGQDITAKVNEVIDFIYNAATSDSLANDSANFSLYDVAVIIPHIGLSSVDANGWLSAASPNGRMTTAKDNFDRLIKALDDQPKSLARINLFTAYCIESIARYGSIYAASVGSGATGLTLLRDGTHQNDLGTLFWLKYLLGWFRFWG